MGTPPFEADSVQSTLRKVKNSKFEFPVEVPLDARPIIGGLLSSEPSHRITLQQILNSRYFDGLEEGEGNNNVNKGGSMCTELNLNNNIFLDKGGSNCKSGFNDDRSYNHGVAGGVDNIKSDARGNRGQKESQN